MLTVDASLVDWIRSFNLVNFFRSVCDGLVLVFQTTNIPIDTVYQLSVIALCVQLILRDVVEPLLCQLDDSNHPIEIARSLAQREPVSIIIYIVPLLTTLFSFCTSLALMLQWHPMEAVVVSGLISLLVVECLVPLSIALCTGLYLAQLMTIESSALLLALVWITCTVCSRCIRVALYPNLGHG